MYLLVLVLLAQTFALPTNFATMLPDAASVDRFFNFGSAWWPANVPKSHSIGFPLLAREACSYEADVFFVHKVQVKKFCRYEFWR